MNKFVESIVPYWKFPKDLALAAGSVIEYRGNNYNFFIPLQILTIKEDELAIKLRKDINSVISCKKDCNGVIRANGKDVELDQCRSFYIKLLNGTTIRKGDSIEIIREPKGLKVIIIAEVSKIEENRVKVNMLGEEFTPTGTYTWLELERDSSVTSIKKLEVLRK
ncbi:hypothetical protein LQZ18_12580 [Lachnospiraceae bacterium ZAX-1]